MAAVQRVRGKDCVRVKADHYTWQVGSARWEWVRTPGPTLQRFNRIIRGATLSGLWCLYDAVVFSEGYEAGLKREGLEVGPTP